MRRVLVIGGTGAFGERLVPIALPLVGRVVHYRGWLAPAGRGTDATPPQESARTEASGASNP